MLNEFLRILKKALNISAVRISLVFLYFIFFLYSSGVISYYTVSLKVALGAFGTRPDVFWQPGTARGFFISGIYWAPTYHFYLQLSLGPVAIAIFMTYVFYTVVKHQVTGTTSWKTGHVHVSHDKSGQITIPSTALASILTAGGCCSVPVGLSVLSFVLPVSSFISVSSLVYLYSYPIDVTFGSVILIFYLLKNVQSQTPYPPRQV